MNIDVVLVTANMLIHPIIVAILYWRKPMPLRRLLNVYFFSSWISYTGNLLGHHFGIWDFSSPIIGRAGTELLYDLMGLPPKVIMLVFLLKPSALYNAILIAMVSGLTITWEWAALNYSQLIVYSNWSLAKTYIAAFVVYSFLTYLWQKKIL